MPSLPGKAGRFLQKQRKPAFLKEKLLTLDLGHGIIVNTSKRVIFLCSNLSVSFTREAKNSVNQEVPKK